MLVVIARLLGYAGAAVLMGAPLAVLRAPSDPPRARALVALAALTTLLSAALGLVAQTQAMAGDPAAGFDPATLAGVLSDTGVGRALAARAAFAIVAGAFVLARARRFRWAGAAAAGLGALLSFAWSGHGAAGEGARGLVHLAADLAHLAAAGVWLGALAALLLMLGARRADLVAALEAFSGVGAATVAVLLASGLANTWFLVGPQHLAALPGSPYGRLLLVKLVLFAVMLGLAAMNRFRLTPRLAAGAPLSAISRSLGLETLAGLAVLALVAALGALEPPSVP